MATLWLASWFLVRSILHNFYSYILSSFYGYIPLAQNKQTHKNQKHNGNGCNADTKASEW